MNIPTNAEELLDEILRILHTLKDDESKLQEILTFLQNESYEPDREVELPEKYRDAVKTIAGYIDSGLVCFLNLDTQEIEFLPEELLYDPEEFEAMTGETLESTEIKHMGWTNCAEFEPLESFESFEIMTSFAGTVNDIAFQQKLAHALNHKQPFANFKFLIDNSEYRQRWFDFKQQFLENHVAELLLMELKDMGIRIDSNEYKN